MGISCSSAPSAKPCTALKNNLWIFSRVPVLDMISGFEAVADRSIWFDAQRPPPSPPPCFQVTFDFCITTSCSTMFNVSGGLKTAGRVCLCLFANCRFFGGFFASFWNALYVLYTLLLVSHIHIACTFAAPTMHFSCVRHILWEFKSR